MMAMIPARAGSEGLPGKNTRMLAGKPMIQWTIAAALESYWCGAVCVNTNDPVCNAIARQCGADVYRRTAHVGADATMADVVRDFARSDHAMGHDALAVLYPTYPTRSAADIDGAAISPVVELQQAAQITGARVLAIRMLRKLPIRVLAVLTRRNL